MNRVVGLFGRVRTGQADGERECVPLASPLRAVDVTESGKPFAYMMQEENAYPFLLRYGG